MRDEKTVKLSQLVSKPKEKFAYEYDFGDSWEHEILLEKILPPDPGVQYLTRGHQRQVAKFVHFSS